MTTSYVKGNRFAPRTTIADAAVEWQGLSSEELDQVVINEDGLPELESQPELLERAEALWDAVTEGHITGLVRNESQGYIAPSLMRLDRNSVADWIAATDNRVATTAPVAKQDQDIHDGAAIEVLLTEKEVMEFLKIGRSTIFRKTNAGEFPLPSHINPKRWRTSQIAEYQASQAVDKARSTKPNPHAAPDEDI